MDNTNQPTYTVTISTNHSDPVAIENVTKYNFANGVAFIQDTDGDIFIYPMHTVRDIFLSLTLPEETIEEGVDTEPPLL